MSRFFDILENNMIYFLKGGEELAKIFNCKDFGGTCNWKGRAETLEDLLKKISKHGAVKHNMKGMTDDMKSKIISVIREQ
jgi:predicted small metal-binding protein